MIPADRGSVVIPDRPPAGPLRTLMSPSSHDSIRILFDLIWSGFPEQADGLGLGGVHGNGFRLAPLQGHLFDVSRDDDQEIQVL